MEIISHRGYWKVEAEKNLAIAFERTFSLGFGTETDIRDYCGDLVVSHDVPTEKGITFSDLLGMYTKSNCQGTLAINIKSDGLQEKIKEVLNSFSVENYFVFDMSIPDTLVYLNKELNVFIRYSEYEPKTVLLEQCSGIWYDSFLGEKLSIELVEEIIKQDKYVAIVSSELHGRDQIKMWEELNNLDINIFNSKKLILCTDLPELARSYFHGA